MHAASTETAIERFINNLGFILYLQEIKKREEISISVEVMNGRECFVGCEKKIRKKSIIMRIEWDQMMGGKW